MQVINTFVARDKQGNRFTIEVFRPDSLQPGEEVELRTADGFAVNYVRPGVFDVVLGTNAVEVVCHDRAARSIATRHSSPQF